MASKIIRMVRRIAGSPVDLTSVVFADPTGTYGIRRRDTLAVHTPVNTPVPRTSEGTYEKELSSLVLGVPYEYYIKRTVGTVSKYIRGTFTATLPTVLATSIFHTYEEFVSRFGLKNIARASNKDNDTTSVNQEAVQAAFDYATNVIEDFFRPVFVIPLDWTPNGGDIPQIVKQWAMNIAYDNLYEVRGWLDIDGGRGKPTSTRNKISALLKKTTGEMALYRGGMRELQAVRQEGVNFESVWTNETISLMIRSPDERPFIIWGW